ncbi:MAG: hypothetical protein EA350_16550 [Gemmatimonadales bacterium]|nr:MAG: hypothetical protein EA350_16550 [Gemmatimonadales bacterium]
MNAGMRWWLAGGLLLLVHGLVLWAVHLPAPHSGGDNAAYLSLASSLAAGTGYTELWDPFEPPHAKYPPAYPLLLALLMAAGASTWGAFKLLSAVLVATAGLLVFAWAGARRGPAFGAGVAIATVLATGWVEASRWILSEPLFLVAVFLALWSADRAGLWLRVRFPAEPPARTDSSREAIWLAVAAGAALLTLFTRTAGLPLLLGLLVMLAWGRRWRALGSAVAVAALPVLLWILRGRAAGEGAYQDEFWLANPYDPGLGTIGVAGLAGRAWTNLEFYVTSVLGGEWWGSSLPPGPVAFLGVVILTLGLVGWGRRVVRGQGGLAELFLPLYGGLVLVWPEVWSGDRFVLPLYPLLLFWGAEAVCAGLDGLRARTTGRLLPPWAAWALGVPALLLLLLPAAPGLLGRAEQAAACREWGLADPFACHGPPFQRFRDAAAWAGANLPGDAVVINRKPRIFHALGGTPGRVFPFFDDPDRLLDQAGELGARYLLVDRVDGISPRYLPGILRSRPEAFCWIRNWGEDAILLGIVGPDAPASSPRGIDETGAFVDCGEAWTLPGDERPARRWGHRIPVVVSPPPPRRLR